MTRMYLKSYKMEGLLPGKIIEEGQPRNDLLFHERKDAVYKKLEQYGITADRNKK